MAELDVTQMHDDLYREIQRSVKADEAHEATMASDRAGLQAGIDAETARAKEAEEANAAAIEAEEAARASAVSTEAATREAADAALSGRIDNLVTPGGDASLQEVVDARMRAGATVAEASLKARLDEDWERTSCNIEELNRCIDVVVNGRNLYNGNYMGGVRVVNNGKQLQYFIGEEASSLYRTLVIPIKPNTTYALTRSNSSYLVVLTSSELIGVSDLQPEVPMTLANTHTIMASNTSMPNNMSFTTDANADFLYVCFTITGENANIYICEGEKTERTTDLVSFSRMKKRYETEFIVFGNNSEALSYYGDGYASAAGFVETDTYKTWAVTIEEDVRIYVVDYAQKGYFSITIFNGEVSGSGFVGRYRNSENNLPTVNNELLLNKGQIVLFTVLKNYQEFKCAADSSQFGIMLSDNVALNEKQINQIKNDRHISRTENDTVIVNGNATYTLSHFVNSSINVDCYRVNSCEFTNSKENIWYSSDADGVVKLVDEDDFLGGYHGDEITTSMRMFIDGVEIQSGDFAERGYNDLVIYCESDIYHCNTSLQSDIKAFKRYKILTFNKDGFRVTNNWVVVNQVNVHLCYFGMLSVNRKCADGITNMLTGYHADGTAKLCGIFEETKNDETSKEVVMHTIYGDAKIRYIGSDGTINYSNVVNYDPPQNRMKVYMGTVLTDGTGIVMNAGDSIKGDYLITI